MEDLISRKALLKHIEKIRQDALMMDDIHRASIIMNGTYLCEEAVEKIVRNQSSAQSEQRRGEWIYDGVKRICPFCKDFIVTGRSIVKYCWNCGARLKERSENRIKINASQAGYIGGWEIKADTRREEDECNN